MQNPQMIARPNPKKRAILPAELYGKFSSKSDFIKYFSE